MGVTIQLKMGGARYRQIDDRARYCFCFVFWTRFGKLNLENFQRKKKKKNIVGIRTHAHSFNGPVQIPLAHRDSCRVSFKQLLYYTAISSFSSLLALTSPNPNTSQILALALTTTRAPRHRCRISLNIQSFTSFTV